MASQAESIKKCKQCGVTGSHIKRCSQCKIVEYCSKKCQREDFPVHKANCTHLRGLYDKTKSLEKLPSKKDEIRIASSWEVSYCPQEYFNSRSYYARELIKIGYQDNNTLAYEAALSNFLELLRLCKHGDDQFTRYHIPFLLLVLNRLEACYAFVKRWSITNPGDGHVRKKQTTEEWLILEGEDILEDILAAITVGEHVERCHLLALILMKIMLMQRIQRATNEEWNTFLLGTDEISGKDSHVLKIANVIPVIDKIHGYLKANSGLEVQEALMKKYCSRLDAKNPKILQAIAFPAPFLCQEEPFVFPRHSWETEAYVFMICGLYAFQKTGAIEKIIEMYGEHPHQDHMLQH